MTKDVFEQKVKELLKNKPEGILVAQIPQTYLHLNNEENNEIRKLYGISTWWKLLGKIDGIEIIGNEDSKKARLKPLANINTNAQPVKATKVEQSQKVEKIEKAEKTTSDISKKTTINLSEKIRTLLTYLNQNLYGKEEAVRLALLSAVANESIFFMGPPGTAKSMISRRIAAAFKDFYKDDKFSTDGSGYFEYLMNEFSTPDEICGPVELSALNEKPSRYVRQTEGYLPSANVAFLDEIWKSGPAILNTLLTIINEKKFHNGNKVEKVPLVSLASASNELPPKDKGLLALWDRFILRVFVNPVENDDDFFKLVDDGNKELVLNDEYKDALLEIGDVEKWQADIDKIELTTEARNVIKAIRQELVLLNADKKHKAEDGENYYVSDRRWKKIVHILKTSAFLNGRKAVDLMDCSLIEYAIWNTDNQHEEIGGIIEKILGQNGIGKATAIGDITDKVDDFKKAVDENWFEEIVDPDIPPKEIIVKIDNRQCYECTRDNTNETWYISVNEYKDQWGYNQGHRMYNSLKSHVRDYTGFSKQGNNISCYYNFTINKSAPKPGKKHVEKKLFEPLAKRTIMESFDKENYIPIVEQIDSEIADLEKFRAENEKPFIENAFANVSRYSPILLNKINEAINNLKGSKLKLKEERERYAPDSNIKSDFKIGDIIMMDGTYKDADSNIDENEIITKVCLIGDTAASTYGLAVEDFGNVNFNKAKEIATSYGKDSFSAPYNEGWTLPTIEQLAQIYENVHDNKAFDFSGNYWSSSVEANKAVNCIDFANGEKDHTTDDHEFKVLLIRKLSD